MVGPAFDCFSNPLGAVRLLFDQACSQIATPSPDFSRNDFGIQDLFRSVVLDSGALPQVPEINSVPLDTIAANSLVRFRGMVQDMFNVEYYVGAFKDGSSWRTNKYVDMSNLPVRAEADMQIWDRRPLYCVPVPGENPWVKDAFRTRGYERSLAHSSQAVPTSKKRHRDSCLSVDEMETDVPEEDDCNEGKRASCGIASCSPSSQTSERCFDLNMPLGEKKLAPCLVKVYDGADADMKLNDVIEFIGVLTFDPELSVPKENQKGTSDNGHATFLEDDICTHLPASKVPRLHCIISRKLSGHRLIPTLLDFEPEWAGYNVSNLGFKELRRSLLEGLMNVLGGDSLCAEYLLLHLLSQVHARVEPMAVGKLSLNLSNWPGQLDETPSLLTTNLTQTIAALLPQSHLMPLSLDSLNGAVFAPRKNYNSNRLMTGALQLADGTHLTLDETALKTGQLTDIGLQNVHLLKNVMEWQKVEYDFEFYKMEMPTDVPVLVLSSATSRLFPADVVVPFKPTRSSSAMSIDQVELCKLRLFLSAARAGEHLIDPSLQKILEEDLVTARQQDRSLGPEVFHRWLTMARLLSLSFGDSALSLEQWHMVRTLEQRCAERCRCC